MYTATVNHHPSSSYTYSDDWECDSRQLLKLLS